MTTDNQPVKQTEEPLKEELFFQDKERDCVECEKEKELQVSFGLSTRQEWDNIMNLIKKYGLSRDEINYIYGFYNREFKDKKSPGCGKCFYNLCKNLEKRYKNLISQQGNQ